jgi:hypothetical protein
MPKKGIKMTRYIVYCHVDITEKDMPGLDELDEELREHAVKEFVSLRLGRFTSYYQLGRVVKEY